jgi:uncharacterized protein YdhG (YjbR/CyaY superfamily)
MKKTTAPVNTVEDYLLSFPPTVRTVLQKMRKTIILAAPAAEEVLSYRMPAYKYKGMLVYFAAHTNHIGFYPFTSAIAAFKKELSGYQTSKGTVQFPFDKAIPLDLVARIIKFRVKENEAKELAKKKKKAAAKKSMPKKNLKQKK